MPEAGGGAGEALRRAARTVVRPNARPGLDEERERVAERVLAVKHQKAEDGRGAARDACGAVHDTGTAALCERLLDEAGDISERSCHLSALLLIVRDVPAPVGDAFDALIVDEFCTHSDDVGALDATQAFGVLGAPKVSQVESWQDLGQGSAVQGRVLCRWIERWRLRKRVAIRATPGRTKRARVRGRAWLRRSGSEAGW